MVVDRDGHTPVSARWFDSAQHLLSCYMRMCMHACMYFACLWLPRHKYTQYGLLHWQPSTKLLQSVRMPSPHLSYPAFPAATEVVTDSYHNAPSSTNSRDMTIPATRHVADITAELPFSLHLMLSINVVSEPLAESETQARR